jgi:hypothetical protein
MEFKGTKGKWEVTVSNEYCGDYSIRTENGSATSFEDEANALLISKAPEMLEMLNNQLEFLIYCRDNMKVSRPVFNQKILRIKQLIKEATEI